MGYNLALAAVMALALSVAFALAATIAEGARRQGMRIQRPLLAGGLCAVVLLGLMGSYAAGRAARKAAELRGVRLVRAFAGDPEHDQRVPVLLVDGRATCTRTSSRSR